jgi:hypothetical protein
VLGIIRQNEINASYATYVLCIGYTDWLNLLSVTQISQQNLWVYQPIIARFYHAQPPQILHFEAPDKTLHLA